MRILIAGGSGFVGAAIVDRFRGEHEFINISLSRRNDFARTNVLLDLSKPLDFLRFDEPIDMVINCVECLPKNSGGRKEPKMEYIESTRHLLEFAKRDNIDRFIHFSVNHINAVENDYQQAKFISEGLVKRSGLRYIIFKPSMIFGENSYLDYLIDSVIKDPDLLNLLNQDSRVSPIHISDILLNISYALDHDEVWNEAYALLGPEPLSFGRLLARRAEFKRPKAAKSFLGRAAKKAVDLPPRLRILLDWANADDSLCRAPSLLEAREYYNE